MKPGDQIYVWRYRSKAGTPLPLPYQHHGIYAGDGQVIHLCGEPGLGRVEAEVRFDDLEHFSRGSAVEVVRHDHRMDPEETIRRATARLGERRYNLLTYNCEHFARECVTGTASSSQVRKLAQVVAVGVIFFGTVRTARQLARTA